MAAQACRAVPRNSFGRRWHAVRIVAGSAPHTSAGSDLASAGSELLYIAGSFQSGSAFIHEIRGIVGEERAGPIVLKALSGSRFTRLAGHVALGANRIAARGVQLRRVYHFAAAFHMLRSRPVAAFTANPGL